MFKVKNTFGSSSSCESSDLTVRFTQDGFASPTCNPPRLTPFHDYVSSMYRAKCVNKFAEVEIFASCKSGGQSKINPNGQTFSTPCGGTNECSHLFVIPCDPDDLCPVGPAHRLLQDSPATNGLDDTIVDDVPEVDADDDGDDDDNIGDVDDDAPYCPSEDFPCEGDEVNMVYVCHYNPRKGYATYCVPEIDSDILRFYSHDYCGPCEGGEGVTWGTMEG